MTAASLINIHTTPSIDVKSRSCRAFWQTYTLSSESFGWTAAYLWVIGTVTVAPDGSATAIPLKAANVIRLKGFELMGRM
jgi:hypothetical protein